MADTGEPVTWQLIKLIQYRLEQISVVNGYRTDIGASVLIEDTQTDERELPYCVIDVSKSTLTRGSAPQRQRTMSFEIEVGISATQDDAKQEAHKVLADLEHAMSISTLTPVAGIRFAQLTDVVVLKRPAGLAAIVLQASGVANYTPN
jgi:hypothetical protein